MGEKKDNSAVLKEFISKRVETTHPKLVGAKLTKAWADEANSVRFNTTTPGVTAWMGGWRGW